MLSLSLASHNLHLAPVFVLGALALFIILDRFLALFLVTSLSKAKNLIRDVRGLVAEDRVEEAIALCERSKRNLTASVIREGLARAHQGESAVRNGIELALAEASQTLSVRTPFLATLANVSTLLGLCGTVWGLIQSFSSVGQLSAQQRTAAMATGISTAMNSTMLGLSVAIVCMVAYSLLMNRIAKINAEMEKAAIHTLDVVTERYLNDGSDDVNHAA